jgi:hypothetical protein
MHIFFLVTFFGWMNISLASEHYPIPVEIQHFYENISANDKENCVVSKLWSNTVDGPFLHVFFQDKKSSNDTQIFFNNLYLYEMNFNPEYKITKDEATETLNLTIYKDGCLYLPAGDTCIQAGVDRFILKIVKNSTTGKIKEAYLNEAKRKVNLFTGNLKKDWSEKGLAQYSCKDGIFSQSLN